MNVALFAALLVALSGPTLAGSSAIQLAAGPSPERHDEWVQRIRAARGAVERAREEEAKSSFAYGHMRRHGKIRGDRREEIVEQRDTTHQARIEAERALEVLLERARREGVPPGWVREALEGFEVSPPAAPH
jgi:hypothetical protein